MQKGTHPYQTLVLIVMLLLLYPGTLGDLVLPSGLYADHGERLVSLPPTIKKVYATTEAGSFLVYSVEPESIAGWNRGLSPEIEFAILPQYHSLPTLGTWDETFRTMQLDEVLKQGPDLIIHYAPVDQTNISLAGKMEETLGIPTVLVDNNLSALPDALRLLGQILGKEVRGQALATFVENYLAQMASFQKLQADYAPIPVHIVSSCEPGHFDELLDQAGMVEMPLWDNEPPLPDFVLIMPHIVSDPYRAIEREGHRRIYQIPTFPANWLEPGSIFCLLGLEWLHSIAHSASYTGDLAATYKAFMEVFFQLNVTPELLEWTLRRSGISY
jgi:iron complex transport system substrate-binding protein